MIGYWHDNVVCFCLSVRLYVCDAGHCG